MNEAEEARVMRDALHFMLRAALLEIRASETVHAARKIADVFHVLPSALLQCSTKEDYEAELRGLLKKAANHGLADYVEKLRDVAILQIKS